MSYRKLCQQCDNFYTQLDTDISPDMCDKCAKEFGIVQKSLAARRLLAEEALATLKLKFPKVRES